LTSKLVNLLLNQNVKKLQPCYSHVDVVIGSIGNALVREKVNLMNYLQENHRTLKVFVDYSDDIISNVSDDFLRENNVQFVVQMVDISSQQEPLKTNQSILSNGSAGGFNNSQNIDIGPEEEAKSHLPQQTTQATKPL
jgi:hypothetical protein